MTRDFLAALVRRPLVSDGAMGTMLFAQGLPQGWCPEEWNESHPEVVQGIHQAYFDAGCDLVETNTFGGTAIKLQEYGYAANAAAWNRRAAEIARAAAGADRFVAGSMGPTGQFMVPLGALTQADVYDAFRVQAVALEQGGADVVFLETMTVIEEIVLGVKAVKQNTKLPVVATMTFEKKRKGYRTMMGVSPEMAVKELQAAGADVVGANCGLGPDLTVEVLREMRAVTDGYLCGQPNAGLPEFRDGQSVFTITPDDMIAQMKPLLALNVRILGGCCGTNPEFLRQLAAMVKSVNTNN